MCAAHVEMSSQAEVYVFAVLLYVGVRCWRGDVCILYVVLVAGTERVDVISV